MKIRVYEDKDYSKVQQICIGGSEDFEGYDILLNMYCNYYIEQEKDSVFILADASDEAVGYIFCAKDWEWYKKIYNEKYLPTLKEMSIKKYEEKCSETALLEPVMKEYPAHLHIDVIKEYRSGGYGSRLIDTLADHLRKKNIRGLMLCVGKDNIRAHKFYEKTGFNRLFQNENIVIYGLKL